MKLIRAKFQNFRLLRDLELEFASDPNKNLTVIRAANESGKTTILHALQWALYGDDALPNNGNGFRLYPIDWDTRYDTRVSITATVEFKVSTYRRVGSETRETERHYILERSAFEVVDSQSPRPSSTVKLFEVDDKGAHSFEEPETIINEEMPFELRDVFFTDGDRALRFIEAHGSPAIKRERVANAIRSLLGLGIIENAIDHVRKSEASATKESKKVSGSDELTAIASQLEKLEEYSNKLECRLKDAKQQFNANSEKVSETESKIMVALQKGDEEKLKKDIENTRSEIKELDNKLVDAKKEHSELFRSHSIARDLLDPLLSRAHERLEEYDQVKITDATIPVLQERLSEEICICGEALKSDNPDGKKRREHIQHLIESSRCADEAQKTITSLFRYSQMRNTESNTWLEDYKIVLEKWNDLEDQRDQAGRRFRTLEQQLDKLSDTDIRELRAKLSMYREQRDKDLRATTEIETKLTDLQKEIKEVQGKHERLLQKEKKALHILSGLDVKKDVIKVLKSAYERITNEELAKVSELMNDNFLEMIGADPDQGAIIRRAEISEDFDIIVYGPEKRTLNPDRDLNGASRRALTLAFILALTEVSQAKAPNVIDTPLGMTSGYVKNSILRTAVRKSAQLVVFLTHDEIAGCEEIIDEAAGKIVTLTNPAHYPKMLVNDPGDVERKVLQCDCDHRGECQLCQRRTDVEVGPEVVL